MVIIELADPNNTATSSGGSGNFIAVRPSGTEPKIKFYMFTVEPPEMLGDLSETESMLNERLKVWESELAAFAKI
jgi:phosphomannomutase